MRIELPDALHIAARMRLHRALTGTVLLAVVIVATAGIAGTTHFAGARWVPHWKTARQTQTPRALPALSSRLPTSAPHRPGSFPLGTLALWIVVAIAAVGVVLLLRRWWTGRPSGTSTSQHLVVVDARPETPVEPEPEPDAPALRTGIELALQMLDDQREPADAIVRAWLGLQETAEESGIVRRPAETPTEFTTRILSRAFADDRATRTLLRLYLRARFGDHPVTGDDVVAARAALQALVRTWPAPAPPAGTQRR